jgi:hypothetical protein
MTHAENGVIRLVFAAIAFLALDVGISAGEPKFIPGCTLPYAAIAPTEPHEVDEKCSVEGKQGSNAKRRAMHRAKNALCADGVPTTLTYRDFTRLQTWSDKNKDRVPFGGPNSLPGDRDDLKDVYKVPDGPRVGEGSLVRYVGFISHPRYSNTKKKGGKGEAVNCNLLDDEHNDIHLDLVRKPGENACLSVTAEIIPHYRPRAWEVDMLIKVMSNNLPVRFTGHLFFDGVHHPCTLSSDGKVTKRASPPRITLWEIHPVYRIDVCKATTLTACPARDDNKWVRLHEWVKDHAADIEEDDD